MAKSQIKVTAKGADTVRPVIAGGDKTAPCLAGACVPSPGA